MGSGHMKLIQLLRADQAAAAAQSSPSFSPKPFSSSSNSDDDGYSTTSSWQTNDGCSSPSRSTPPKSPWSHLPGLGATGGEASASGATGLIASLVKEEGHVYSVAAAGDLLYTGTDSETVRVWRDRREVAAFRTGSGLVKSIVVAADGRIFTGHQDGKIRVWRRDADADGGAASHRRVGSLPRLADYVITSVNPSSYVRQRRKRREVWLRHSDAVSCLSLDERAGILYSGSWDATFKAWRVSDSRCLGSVNAHDDAVNAVAAAGFDAVVFTGSADGTVKAWRRRVDENTTPHHVLEAVVRRGESAVTAIAVAVEDRVVYVGSSDGDVTCWRWVDGEARYGGVLGGGHGMAVMCLAVAGNVVVSGSADRTLRVWRRDGGSGGGEHARVAVLAGHAGPVKCVAVDEEEYTPSSEEDDGERRFVVYSGSLDGSVKVWRVAAADEPTTNSPAAAAAAASDRTLTATPQQIPSRVWRREDQTPAWAAAAYRTSEMNSVAAA
uniref:Uncharacterized protein n=1 Tax=Leersia perrieri TaxID=77586 RepID=A0A0D9VWH9_9ORYZ